MKPTHYLREHHDHLVLEMEGFEELVDKLPYLKLDELKPAVLEKVDFLKNEIIPHAASEERYLYKEIDYLACRESLMRPSSTMEIDHEYIKAYIERLAELAGNISPKSVPEFQRSAWELLAIIKLHFDKEERVYLPLLDKMYTEEEVQHRIAEKMERYEEESHLAARREADGGQNAKARRFL